VNIGSIGNEIDKISLNVRTRVIRKNEQYKNGDIVDREYPQRTPHIEVLYDRELTRVQFIRLVPVVK
jgi:hypothetical protein